jgi:L-amino acid N-acyltransferase YncA
MELRAVTAADLPAVGEIYNHYVLHSTCTFATEPEGEEYWRNWFSAHVGPHPAIVAVDEGKIVGWGTLSKWNNRCAYRFSVEDSVYIHKDQHRRGLGRTILTELVALARKHGHRNIVAQIAGDQLPSEKLHAALGFRKAGTLESIGYKFDKWIDVSIWQLRLDGGT